MSRFMALIKASKSQSLENFVSSHRVDKMLEPATEKQIQAMENTLCVKAGKQFRQYLLSYGGLSYKFIEIMGISGNEVKPKLIEQTLFLRKQGTDVPKNMIPVYKIHDEGVYAMVDSSDNMYEVDVYHYFKGIDKPMKINMKFNDFVLALFTYADKG